MHRPFRLLSLVGAVALAASACGDDEPPPQLPQLVITTTSLPAGAAETDYQAELTATGGTGQDYRWSIARGGLPGGVFLRSEGTPSTVIAGFPSTGANSNFTVRVTDSAGNVATKELSIMVEPRPAAVQISTTMLRMAMLFEPYDEPIAAMNGSGYEWRVVSGEIPPGLTLAATGTPETRLTGSPTEVGRYSFTLRVRDAAGEVDTQQFQMEVVDVRPRLALPSTRLTDGTVGFAYRFDLVAMGGSLMGYQWSVVNGSLPPGLSLAATGTPNAPVTGTPTEEGFFSFRVEVEDSEGQRVRQSFSVEIKPPPPPLRITTFEVPAGRVAQAYTQALTAVNGSAMGYTWTVRSGTIPPGLRITSGTPNATLEGTPTQEGTFDFVVEVRDSLGSVDDQAYRMVVGERILPLVITATNAVGGVQIMPDAEGGQPYPHVLRATGGAPLPSTAPESEVRYNWVITGGELPPGMSLVVAGREPDYAATFAGRPSRLGTYTATVTVYDRFNTSASQRIRITVVRPTVPIRIVTTQIPPLASAGCFQQGITAEGGGNADYEWSIVSGSLPQGYSLDRTGTPTAFLRGSPPDIAGGTFDVRIRVQDGFGLFVEQDLTLTVDRNRLGTPRWGVVVGTIESTASNDIYVRDLCDPTNPAPIKVNRTISGTNVRWSTSVRFLVEVSPRLTALAYIADADTDGEDEVYVVDLRTPPAPQSAVRVLDVPVGALSTADAEEIRWSPDGRKLAIVYDPSFSFQFEMWVADVSDLAAPQQAVRVSQPATSTLNMYSSGRYEWSPNSQKLAWVGDLATSGVDELWVVDLSGPTPGTPQRAHSTPLSTQDVNGHFYWTADSRGIVHNADWRVVSDDELFFTDVSGPGPYSHVLISGTLTTSGDVQTNFTPRRDEHTGFSPDGTRLFWIGDNATLNMEEVWVVDYSAATGTFSARRQLTQATTASTIASADSAKFSPDGTRIAVDGSFRSSSQDEVYILDPTATTPVSNFNPLRAAPDTARELGLSFEDDYIWSPDSTRIGFIGDFEVSGAEELYVAHLTTTPVTVVKVNEAFASSSQNITEFRWSPDGRRVAYLSTERGSSLDELRVADVSRTTRSSPVLAHAPVASTLLDVYQNFEPGDFSWFWASNDILVFRGDIETDGCDRGWILDLNAQQPYRPSLLTAGVQMATCSNDINAIHR